MNLEELEKRIRKLEDIEEIKMLHRQYVFWLANRQFKEMLDLFTEDAIVNVGQHGLRKGKKEIEELFSDVLSKVVNKKDGHLVAQPIISVDGDRAKSQWIMYLFFPEPSASWAQGKHDCEYVKENGKWKFSSVKFTRPWPEQAENFDS